MTTTVFARLQHILAPAAIGAILLASTSLPKADAADPPDFEVAGGWFYTQTNGQDGAKTGFAVVDNAKGQFYREFKRLGGIPTVGYPVSGRFTWDGFETQAFQKLIFQWRPEKDSVDFVNVFDKLNDAGKDDWLLDKKGVPRQGKFNEEGKDIGTIQKERLALLDVSPAIRKFYFAVPGDAIAANGLPTSPIVEINNAAVLRAQRVVLQEWKVNVPWARAGDVTLANGGDVAKEAGILPADAVKPVDATASANPSVQPTSTPVARPAASPSPAVAAPSTPARPVVGPLNVSIKLDTPLPSGGEGRATIKVTGADGVPVSGSIITVLVHFPLGPNDTAYATDLVLFIQTAPDGNGIATIRIPKAVPTGIPIRIEATALYPPHTGRDEIGTSVA